MYSFVDFLGVYIPSQFPDVNMMSLNSELGGKVGSNQPGGRGKHFQHTTGRMFWKEEEFVERHCSKKELWVTRDRN